MLEQQVIHSKEEAKKWEQDRRNYDYYFEANFCHHISHNKFPLLVVYVDTESNGYPSVEYDIFYPVPRNN